MKAKLITFVRGLSNGTPPRFQSYLKSLTLLLTMLLSVNVWGDEVYKTSKFGSAADSGTSNNYTSTFTTTTDGFSVDVKNGNTNNTNWALVKFGTNSAASTGYITTHAAIDAAVTKVSIKISAITANNITSITLYSGSSATTCTTNLGTFTKSTGTQSVTIASPQANKFYKIEFVCTKASSNGPISVAQVDFYKAASNPITSLYLWEAGVQSENLKGDYKVGAKYTLPSTCSQTCGTKTFVGWSKVAISTPSATKPTSNYYDKGAEVTLEADNNFYAVFADASGGGSETKSYGFEDSDDETLWIVDGPAKEPSNAHSGSKSGKITTNNTYVQFKNKVKVTSFSYWFKRSSTNSNYYVYIETSTTGEKDDWEAVDTQAMNSFNNGSYASSAVTKTFDGTKELYVRFHCYNTTAVRYVDDISITYSGGTTYSNYTTTCGPSTYTLLSSGQKVGSFSHPFSHSRKL